jgi:uncharacterized membrane protein YvlD (DUF360 family)
VIAYTLALFVVVVIVCLAILAATVFGRDLKNGLWWLGGIVVGIVDWALRKIFGEDEEAEQ